MLSHHFCVPMISVANNVTNCSQNGVLQLIITVRLSLRRIFLVIPGCKTVSYADNTDDILVLGRAAVPIDLDWCINWALRAVADWIQTAGLNLAVDKSEAILFTSKYKMRESMKLINISHSIKYLDLQIDHNDD